MTLNLNRARCEALAREAVRAFWDGREAARQRQQELGTVDQGERGAVTGGANMDGFLGLLIEVIEDNALPGFEIHRRRAVLTLPGFFRPTKLWDLLVTYGDELIAAIELKSHIGPSFGKNFNNRCEEAIGTAADFWTAHREGAFLSPTQPFVGWLILVESAPGSNSVVRDAEPHYGVSRDFRGKSCLQRYDVVCQKLMRERLYSAASVLATSREDAASGRYEELSRYTGLTNFVGELAGHIATASARLR